MSSTGNVALSVGLNFELIDDSVSIAEDSGATTVNVLSNDTNNGSGTLSVVSVTQPTTGGTVTLDAGVVSFTPDADFNGTTEFTYRAGDGSGAQDTATVTVNVTAVNDTPPATPIRSMSIRIAHQIDWMCWPMTHRTQTVLKP